MGIERILISNSRRMRNLCNRYAVVNLVGYFYRIGFPTGIERILISNSRRMRNLCNRYAVVNLVGYFYRIGFPMGIERILISNPRRGFILVVKMAKTIRIPVGDSFLLG